MIQFIVKRSIPTAAAMAEAAHYLLGMMCRGDSKQGPPQKGVLVKGGHFDGDASGGHLAKDFLLIGNRNGTGGWDTESFWLSSPRSVYGINFSNRFGKWFDEERQSIGLTCTDKTSFNVP